MNILFLAPYPKYITPSQRFRFEHYLPEISKKRISYTYETFVTDRDYKLIFKPGNIAKKVFVMMKGLARRFFIFFSLHKYDYVFIHREAAPFGPPVLEWLISKVWKKKIIYDFDDAIWVPLSSIANPLSSKIKCTWKISKICRWSHITTVGNDYLATFARQYAANVVVIPTVVDTEQLHNKLKDQSDKPFTIGWTGTFTNFYNLEKLIIPIKKIQENYECVFQIIADKDPGFKELNYTFIYWNKATEIDDLLKFNVGLMPLNNTEVEMGKCAFKAIQYLSLGIPAVVSPVGANCNVVINDVVGFWAETEEDWYNKLEILINSPEKRSCMGKEARKHIIDHYSVAATSKKFFNLFSVTHPV